ncbi:MAG: substrate-binding domain-containing protein [Lachnotalea sp.]
MDDRNFVIILSDIHMGTAAPTVCYRKEVHEKYLITVLNDIIVRANQIREVVLLGDIFEFWTYPPDQPPPTIDDIIATHPKVLGTKGKLCQLLSVLEGRVVFIPGDHDMNVTQSDLNKIISAEGYTISYKPSYYIPSYDRHIKFAHGHEFTLLNAPYFVSKISPIPIGYFVSKAIAYKIQNESKKDANVTESKLMQCTGNSITEIFSKDSKFLEHYEESLDFVSCFIDELADATGMPKNRYIKVSKKIEVCLNEVKKIYSNLNNDFNILLKKQELSVQKFQLNDLVQVNKTYLPNYIQKSVLDPFIDIIVMGHTHHPLKTFVNRIIQYVNVGSMCPFSIKTQTEAFTYGIYNLSTQCVDLMEVSGENTIKIHPYKNIIRTCKKNSSHITSNKNINKAQLNIEIKEENIIPVSSFTFGWSVYDSSLEFWKEMQKGVLSKGQELGIDILTNNEKSNTIEMITGSIDLIGEGINALIIAPFNPELLPAIVANAQKYKVPVVAIDTGTGGADVVGFIVSDSFGGGVYAGEYALILINKYLIKSKNIAIIKVQKTAKYALMRGEGFKSVMLAYGYIVVAEETANSVESEGYEVMKSILATYANDLAVVFSENGTMALGAARAIEEAGKKGIIMLIGFDATPSVINAIKNGLMQGTIAQQPFEMGELGVEIANLALLGKPISYDDTVNKLILMEVYLVDEKGNIRKNII